MELARDARALLRGREPRLALEHARVRLERSVLAARVHERAHQPRPDREDQKERAGPHVPGAAAGDVGVLGRVHAEARKRQRQPEHAPSALAVGGHAVGDQRPEDDQLQTLGRVPARERLSHDTCHHQCAGQQRHAPPPQERQRDQKRQRNREPPRPRDVRPEMFVAREHLPLRDHGDQQGGRRVEKRHRARSGQAGHGQTVAPVAVAGIGHMTACDSSSRMTRIDRAGVAWRRRLLIA